MLLGHGGTEAVLRVDLATGDRTTVSQFGVVGTGVEIGDLAGLAASTPADLFALDRSVDAVLHVDVLSGHRTLIADATHGLGPDFVNPLAIAYDAARERVLVADSGKLITVDPLTGDRALLSGPGVGSGPPLGDSFGVAVIPEPSPDLLGPTGAAAIALLRRRARTGGRRRVPRSSVPG